MRPSANERRHHHYHNIHHTYKREAVNGRAEAASNKGYDRRAELLKYSQHLREFGQTAPSLPLRAEQISNNNLQPPTRPIVHSQRKTEYEGRPACFGNWKILIPSLLRSWTSPNPKSEERKMKDMPSRWPSNPITNLMKKFEVKRRCFVSKVLSTTRRHF